MFIEFILAGMLIFAGGSYLGSKSEQLKQPAEKVEQVEPRKWPAINHREMIRECSISCGENNLREYNMIYGKCVCKTGE